MRTLLQARKVVCLDAQDTTATWVLFDEQEVLEVGEGEPPGSDQTVSTEGVVLPGLIDAHVHLVATGLYRTGLDLRECRSVEALLGEVRTFLDRSPSDWILAGNFDPGRNPDSRMPTRNDLDPVTGGKVLFVSRADGHSSALNSAALEAIGTLDLPGVEIDEDGRPTGILANRANYEARARFFGGLPADELKRAQVAACEAALERGVTSVHEMGVGDEEEINLLLSHLQDLPIAVRPYFATTDIGKVAATGMDCIGGDFFLDGSIGSRTAAFEKPYEDHDGSGTLYHPDEEITGLFIDASRAGMQAGVHAIGDAAIEQAIRCMEAAFLKLGPEGALGARRLRHRIEHFECVSSEQIERVRKLGVVASVQPMFDKYWGGEEGMYFDRLGDRSRSMNPFSKIVAAGVTLAGGSDSTVTPLDPFLGMAAAMAHHSPEFALNPDQALRAFSIWGAYAGREEGTRGSIEPGKRPDFCVVDQDPRELDPDAVAGLSVRQTWVGGSPVWPSA